jgi:uncharacterized protein YbjT (DUF2867 family)
MRDLRDRVLSLNTTVHGRLAGMPNPTVLVTGATGQQGGAVVRHLLAAGFSIRTLVRNPESAASQALAQKGVQVVPGDFGQPESLRRAMIGVDRVFSVQPFLRGKSYLEVQWGKDVADAAANEGVSHFVYTSVLGAGSAPDVPHFAGKAEIEGHIQSTRMPHTILQPGGFMENLLMPVVLKGISKGKLTTPNKVDSPQPLIAVDDIGAIAAKVFALPGEYIGKKIPLVGEVISTRNQAETLARVLGRPIRPGQLPGIVVRVFLGRDLLRMFRWIDTSSGTVPFNIEALRMVHPGLSTFEDWCRHNFSEASASQEH